MRRILIALAVLVLGAGALELGARLVDRARGSPWDAEESKAEVASLLAALSAPWVPPGAPPAGAENDADAGLQPFTGWQPAEVQARIADDLDAYERPDSSAIYDVCLLGGSGAAAFADEAGQGFLETLARDPRLAGREIRLHPYGIEGTKQPQAERLLAYLLSLGHRPDAVIEIDGLDEAGIGWSNAMQGTSPLYPSAEIWARLTQGLRFDWDMVELLHELEEARSEAKASCERHLRLRLWRSCVLDHAGSHLLDWQLRRVEAAEAAIRAYVAQRAREAELRGPRTSTEPEALAATIVSAWEEASVDMHALCESRGIAYLHVLEPEPVEGGGGKPRSSAGVELVRPRLRDAGERLKARGIAFLDGDSALGDRSAASAAGLAEAAARALPVR
jgi:hypothetical protein